MYNSKVYLALVLAILVACLVVNGCGGDEETLVLSFGDGPGCTGLRGNVDGDRYDCCNQKDIDYLNSFLFEYGPQLACWDEANVNGRDGVDIADLTYLIAYIWCDGPPPVACPDWDF